MIETLSITVEEERAESDLEVLRSGIRQFNEQHVAAEPYEELTVLLRDQSGHLLGASLSETGRGWLHVSLLWVDETTRGHGYGRRLMETTESEAIERGCRNAYLDTFSYQAKPFYERLGYEVFGLLDDYPVGHRRYFMRKRLIA